MCNNIFTMKRAGILISLICNLNCKLCAAYSPYNTKTVFPSIEELKEYIHRYFTLVDHIELFTVSGGEPLLYKQLPDFMEELLKYSNQIGRFEIITNGTIVPEEKLLNVVKKFKTTFSRFLVDNYGEGLSKKVDEIEDVLNNANIPFEVRNNNLEDMHCGGWVDFGSLDKVIHSPDETFRVFSKCVQPKKLGFCFGITEGKLYPCAQVYRRICLGQNVSYGDYVDLMDDTLSIEEQRKKILNIYNAKCLETCAYCNGWNDDSPRFTPAEQLTAEEIRTIKASLHKGRAD